MISSCQRSALHPGSVGGGWRRSKANGLPLYRCFRRCCGDDFACRQRFARGTPPRATSPASTQQQQQMLASERAAVSELGRDELVRALQRLGEPAPAGAPRGELAARLAARRLAERARVVRLPLRLSVAPRRSGRRYLTVPVDVGDAGFVDFLLDAGAATCLITPATRDRLGLGPGDGAAVRALDSRGPTVRQRVELPDMWLGTFKLPRLTACVSDLPVSRGARRPQEQQQQQQQQTDLPPPPPPPQQQQQQSEGQDGDQPPSQSQPQPPALPPSPAASSGPGGLLGVSALRHFDVDIDWAGNRLVMHPAGHAAAGLVDTSGLRPVPCRATKAGLVLVSVSLAGSAPILGVLDLSAAVTILNWEAAALLGMRCEGEERDSESGADGGGGQAAEEDEDGGGGSSSSGSSGNGVGRGYFGQVRVRPSEQLLLDRPAAALVPRGSGGGGGNGDGGSSLPQIRLPADAERRLLTGSSDDDAGIGISSSRSRSSRGRNGSSSKSGGGGGTSSTPARLQTFDAYEHELRIVVGAGSRAGGARVPPPARLAVAHLSGLAQVGLAGRPAVVLGGDVWGRRRAVLCLKAGVLYL